jgi:hypothetical protein
MYIVTKTNTSFFIPLVVDFFGLGLFFFFLVGLGFELSFMLVKESAAALIILEKGVSGWPRTSILGFQPPKYVRIMDVSQPCFFNFKHVVYI